MSNTIQYKDHRIDIEDVVYDTYVTWTCTAHNTDGELVVSFAWTYTSQPVTDPAVACLQEAKRQIDRVYSGPLFNTYRTNGLKFISRRQLMDSISFVRGKTRYWYSHQCTNKLYHYKGMPPIAHGDLVQFHGDDEWWQIRFINENNQHGPVYYAINSDMRLRTFGTAKDLTGYKQRADVPSDLIISDKNDRAMSIRIPSYLYDILSDEVAAFNDYGMTMNATIRECLIFAIDCYFDKQE